MKRITLSLALCANVLFLAAQTNSLPSSGDVGIGIDTPLTRFHIRGITGQPENSMFISTNSYTNGSSGSVLRLGHGSSSGNTYGWIENLTTGGTIAGDLVLQPTTGNVGIGTIAPAAKFHLYGTENANWVSAVENGSTNGHQVYSCYNNGTMRIGFYIVGGASDANSYDLAVGTTGNRKFLVRGDGNVGIGGTDPSNKLQIGPNGAGYAGNDFVVSNTNGTMAFHNDATEFYMVTNNRDIAIGANGVAALHIKADGKIGIGTKTPSSALAVNGDIYAKKVKVTQTGWPDYVFTKEYSLKPLSEVEAYIIKFKHLPEVPSAQEVEKNDLDLGEMNKILLMKVEELTLYMIELKKENELQKARLDSIENKIK